MRHLHESIRMSALCSAIFLLACSSGEEDISVPTSEDDGGPCETISDCLPGAFACTTGRCQMWQKSICPETGLGVPCSFESMIDNETYEGRCTFHGDVGDYFCAPDCTDEACPQPDSICHPVQPTGQPGNLKACMPPCTDTYQCLGGTWECNTDGQCVIPNEEVCNGKSTLDPCSFEGSDGKLHEGICSRPPPTIDGPPYYSETNLCVRVCDPSKPETCDRLSGVCQPAEPEGLGSGPNGVDYAVCVAPVCNGDEDCTGGMFGCENQTCVLPSFTVCEGVNPGETCEVMVAGNAVDGHCSPMGMCLPSCTPTDGSFGLGDCRTHPESTICLEFVFNGEESHHLCIDPSVGGTQ